MSGSSEIFNMARSLRNCKIFTHAKELAKIFEDLRGFLQRFLRSLKNLWKILISNSDPEKVLKDPQTSFWFFHQGCAFARHGTLHITINIITIKGISGFQKTSEVKINYIVQNTSNIHPAPLKFFPLVLLEDFSKFLVNIDRTVFSQMKC